MLDKKSSWTYVGEMIECRCLPKKSCPITILMIYEFNFPFNKIEPFFLRSYRTCVLVLRKITKKSNLERTLVQRPHVGLHLSFENRGFPRPHLNYKTESNAITKWLSFKNLMID